MRTDSRGRARALTMAVLTVVVGLSGHAQAQQTGLLPLAPIRRQRVPCDREDPTYKIYKQQYFGYHPTCWRTFPAGWGCPSAEAPDKARSFRENPPGQRPAEEGMGGAMPGEEPGAQPAPERGRQALPLPPDTVSPFEERPGGGAPNVAPLPRGNARPETSPSPRGEDPFDEMNRGGAPPPAGGRPGARLTPAPSPGVSPELTAPAGTPASGSAARSVEGEEDDDPTEGERPLLGLSDSDLVRSDGTGRGPDSQPVLGAAPASEVDVTAAAPPAPPRRRIFGNLLSGLGSNWIRR